jgi:hypothetical protein
MATFTSGIPNSANTPANDQPLMLGNFNYINESYGKDHNFTNSSNTSLSNPDGYHTVIHQLLQGSTPPRITNVNQIFAKNYTPPFSGSSTDTQLFSRTGLGVVSQLTGYQAQVSGGWQWVGGILMIWGVAPLPALNVSGTVTFTSVSGTTIPFPNAIFTIQMTLISTTFAIPTNATLAIAGTPTTTSFQWAYRGDPTFNGFYWLAIGN